MGRPRSTETEYRENFWSKMEKTETCWLWAAGRDNNNYGRFTMNGKSCGAHRVAYEFTYGSIPKGLIVRHLCNNPPCVRPDHLAIGDYVDNMRDAIESDRIAYGERQGLAVLTDEKVVAIRVEYATGKIGVRTLANKHNLSSGAMRDMLKHKTWKHLPPCEDATGVICLLLTTEKIQEIGRLYDTHEYSRQEIADRCGVSKRTIDNANQIRKEEGTVIVPMCEKVSPETIQTIKELWASGKHSGRAIARICNVSPGTAQRYKP